MRGVARIGFVHQGELRQPSQFSLFVYGIILVATDLVQLGVRQRGSVFQNQSCQVDKQGCHTGVSTDVVIECSDQVMQIDEGDWRNVPVVKHRPFVVRDLALTHHLLL
jgi:hypothetical protein